MFPWLLLSNTIRVSYTRGCCQSSGCCKSVCYSHCFIFSRAWNPVYQTQQVSKNVTISYFHHCPPFNLRSVICMATARSVLLFPLILSPTAGEGLLVWVQFLIHIGSGRWISPSCSSSLFHLAATLLFRVTQSLHGYSKWMNMLWARAKCIYFHKYHPHIIISLLVPKMSGESFIIFKTGLLQGCMVYQLHICRQINKQVPLKTLKTINYSPGKRKGKSLNINSFFDRLRRKKRRRW